MVFILIFKNFDIKFDFQRYIYYSSFYCLIRSVCSIKDINYTTIIFPDTIIINNSFSKEDI